MFVLAMCLYLTGCSTSLDNKPFFFIHMTDPQFGMFTENEDFAKETELFAETIHHVNRLRPAFLVITGDVIHRPRDRMQTAEVRRILGTLNPDIPLYLLPGNHDIGGTPTHDGMDWYRNTFGPDHFVFTVGRAAFVGLNSCIIHTPDNVRDLTRAQRDWLETTLADLRKSQPEHLVVFQHHPLFLHQPDEEDEYFNMPSDKRQDYLALYKQYGVTAVMAGHYHRNSHGTDGSLEMIITGSVGMPLGNDPPGFRIVKVFPDRLEHSYHTLDAVPEKVLISR
jgi:3',5'-cyclic AMP phosphodiesterase CpdA